MRHIQEIPDCPECGTELVGTYKFTADGNIDGHWFCQNCGYESKHIDHIPYEDVVNYVEEIGKEKK